MMGPVIHPVIGPVIGPGKGPVMNFDTISGMIPVIGL